MSALFIVTIITICHHNYSNINISLSSLFIITKIKYVIIIYSNKQTNMPLLI